MKCIPLKTVGLEKNFYRLVPDETFGIGFHGEVRRKKEKDTRTKKERRESRLKK